MDSHEAIHSDSSLLDKFRNHVASIVRRGSVNAPEQTATDSTVSNNDLQVDCEDIDVTEVNEEPIDVTLTPPESPSEYLRLLSRSESANDAKILDKLEQSARKNCSRTLQFNNEDIDELSKSPSK